MSPSATLSSALSRWGSGNLYMMIVTVAKEIVRGTTYQYTRTFTDPASPLFLVRLIFTKSSQRVVGSIARTSTALLPPVSKAGMLTYVILNSLLLSQRYNSFMDPVWDGIGIVMRMTGGDGEVRDDNGKTRTESDIT
jgi:hypothetical protein